MSVDAAVVVGAAVEDEVLVVLHAVEAALRVGPRRLDEEVCPENKPISFCQT